MRMTSRRSSVGPSAAAQRGFSLMEAMVSIVVLAFGLLSVVGVQLSALRGNQHAAQASAAASLARDYQEILLSLPSLVLDPQSAHGFVEKNIYANFGSAKECKGTSADCTSQEFADFQMRDWLARVQAALPAGVASVCFDNAFTETSGASTGLYRWECSNTGELLVVKIGWATRGQRTQDGKAAESGIEDGKDRPRLVMPVTGNQAGYRL
jgi:type IV pilus assembly protein PilV